MPHCWKSHVAAQLFVVKPYQVLSLDLPLNTIMQTCTLELSFINLVEFILGLLGDIFFLIHILIDNSVSKKWILWSNSTLCALLVLSGIKYVMHMWSMLSIRKQRVNSGYTIPQSYSSLFVGKMIKKLV